MYFISSDYQLAANGHTMLNACDCFTTWNCKERAFQTKYMFSIKKLVPSDRCDSKPGKIKKDGYNNGIYSVQAGREVAHRNCITSPFPYITKTIRQCKSVCFV